MGALVNQHDRQSRQRDRRRCAEQAREPLGREALREQRERDYEAATGKALDEQDQDVVDCRELPGAAG
jgi:hypothetical protein